MASESPVRTGRAPAPFQGAPSWQAIRAGEFVFVFDQLPLRPGSAEVVGTIREQTEQVFANVSRTDMVDPRVAAILRVKPGRERLRLAHEE